MQTRRFTQTPGMTLAVMRMLKGRKDTRSHTTPRAPRTQTFHMPYARRTNMKCVSLWMIGIGLCITVGLLTVQQGYAGEEDDGPTCTLETLKGRYLFGGIATLLPPAVPEQSLLAVAGYHIFNGDGTGIDIVAASINGVSVENNAGHLPDRSEYEITYTVNPDCSGTYTVTAAGVSFGLFVAPNGEELIVIGTDPGVVLVQGPNRRVSRK
jgi:hypothetical protein